MSSYSAARRPQPLKQKQQAVEGDRSLTIRWPWWLQPACAFALLTGTMAVVASNVSAEAYAEWRVPKYLVDDLPLILAVLMMSFFLGIVLGSGMSTSGGAATLTFTPLRVKYLKRAYRSLFVLAILGYLLWFGSAIAQGISVDDLLGVLNRQEGAIGTLKENSRPIGGVTTMTQFGPVAVALGVLLRKLGVGGRSYWWFFLLAGVRAMFYAERLALIEVAVPLIIISALTVNPERRCSWWIRVAPLFAVPAIWTVFAAFEYTRSWVYYQTITTLPFLDWVSLRLAGYYTTSFNNSALMVEAMKGGNDLPYFSVDGFWNAPFVSDLLPYPGRLGMPASEWWAATLKQYANPEFNNTGSFLVSYAEFGFFPSVIIWLVLGIIVGAIFSRMTKGSLPALLAVSTLFVGILELSRFTYWTQGRAFPVLLALVLIGLTYPRAGAAPTPKTKLPKWASEPAGRALRRVPPTSRPGSRSPLREP